MLTADFLVEILEKVESEFRDRIFPPVVTLAAFLSQVLSEDHSCRETVARVIADRTFQGKEACSAGTSAYCQARNRLPKELIFSALRETGKRLKAFFPWQWRGRRIVLVDGTTVSMPDTQDNQAVYPQPASQKPGLGFPLARLVVLISLATGGVLDVAIGSQKGKETGEHALLRQILASLASGDVLVGDRYYCSYFLVCSLLGMGVDFVFQNHVSRKTDFRKGQRLGTRDHIVEWKKSVRPSWMSKEAYAAMPATLRVRETKVSGLVLVSSFLDAKKFPKEELSELYRQRWHVEIDLKFIKQIMKMDIMRGKTPDMVQKEIGVHLLAYNLIRTVMAQSAHKYGIMPNQISFKGAIQALTVFQDRIEAASSKRRILLMNELLHVIAQHRIGNRPGRKEPRAVKRRPKPFRRLTQPRGVAQ